MDSKDKKSILTGIAWLKDRALTLVGECDEHRMTEWCAQAMEYQLFTIEWLEADKAEAIDRINDMLMGDDGQAFKEARKFVDKHSASIASGNRSISRCECGGLINHRSDLCVNCGKSIHAKHTDSKGEG